MAESEMITTLVKGIASILLFVVVCGMSATVDKKSIDAQASNLRAIIIGLFLQFVCLPFLGFVACKLFHLEYEIGMMLLVITSSPSGTLSNWFSSLFNADLALSIIMTQTSTAVSMIMLPFNIFVYEQIYNDRYGILPVDIQVVVAIGILFASSIFQSDKFPLMANRIGNGAAILFLVLSAVVSNRTEGARLWDHDARFYLGVAFPCVMGWVITMAVTTVTTKDVCILDLPGPERVTVAMEGCIPNFGYAILVALRRFEGDNSALALALSVPFYYGIIDCALATAYSVYMWKCGWTKAPKEVSFCEMVTTSYEIAPIEVEDDSNDFHSVDDATLPKPPINDKDNDGIQFA